jgi:hypothetical protein
LAAKHFSEKFRGYLVMLFISEFRDRSDPGGVHLSDEVILLGCAGFDVLCPYVLQSLAAETPDAGANYAVRHQALLCPVEYGT